MGWGVGKGKGFIKVVCSRGLGFGVGEEKQVEKEEDGKVYKFLEMKWFKNVIVACTLYA